MAVILRLLPAMLQSVEVVAAAQGKLVLTVALAVAVVVTGATAVVLLLKTHIQAPLLTVMLAAEQLAEVTQQVLLVGVVWARRRLLFVLVRLPVVLV
jgi:hypothetical protein